MRSWMEAINLLGVVVTMVQERIEEPSGECHSSHNPAKAKGLRVFKWMKWGIFVFEPGSDFHS